jgi:flagellar export protein FliJ
MAFVYRLQKILQFRMQKRDEQIEAVKQAELEVIKIQTEIDAKKQEIYGVKKNMYKAHHSMMEAHDNYIKHLYDLIEKLEEKKNEAIKILEEEKEKLIELEKAVKVLEKHKEKAKDAYLDEERILEMKRLDEVAGIKHFRKTLELKLEEEEEEMLKALEDQYEY